MMITVIIIHYGQQQTTRECLTNLKKKIKSERVVLINNSSEELGNLASIIPDTVVIDNRRNVGFAAAVNQGMQIALADKKCEFVLLMNNDASFSFGSPEQLARTFIHKKSAGIVSPVPHSAKGYDWGGSIQRWSGLVKHRNFNERPKTILTVDHVAGAVMMIKREVVEKVGVFDERFFLYYEDADYCLRARREGYVVHINPEIVVEHHISAASNPVGKSMRVWTSHLKFVSKYMPSTIYPTAIVIDVVYYPLILVWSYIKSVL